jgi:hypothetical protein
MRKKYVFLLRPTEIIINKSYFKMPVSKSLFFFTKKSVIVGHFFPSEGGVGLDPSVDAYLR